MAELYINGIFGYLLVDLVQWVRTNPKTANNITFDNSKYLFHFDMQKGLFIDLTRFNETYYCQAFNTKQVQKHSDAFVHKVCIVMRIR